MASFFNKCKPSLKSSASTSSESAPVAAGPSRSEFEKTFKPFVLKKDAELAPTNWFTARRQRGKNQIIDDDIIILDPIKTEDEDIIMEDVESADVGQMTTEG